MDGDFVYRVCLAASIEHSDAPKVKCPFKDDDYSCDMEILEREIKAVGFFLKHFYETLNILFYQLVSPAVLLKHQRKSMKEAEANMKNAFHCKTPDCAGWTIFDDDVNIFKCPLCNKVNCITCQVRPGTAHISHPSFLSSAIIYHLGCTYYDSFQQTCRLCMRVWIVSSINNKCS